MSQRRGGFSTRVFAAGPVEFVVNCSSDELRVTVEAIFADLPSAVADEGTVALSISLGADGLANLDIPGRTCAPQPPTESFATLITAVSRLALDAEPSRLHLHCAALDLDGKGLLISATSGTGKTTLAASLALRGWRYTSDEAVGLALGERLATGFAKPLVIKPGGRELMPELDQARVSKDWGDEHWWYVPASSLSAPIAEAVDPAVVVLLHRSLDDEIDETPQIDVVHPADAVVQLMAETMDPERFGESAVLVLAELAARCRCVSVSVGPIDDTVDGMIAQFENAADEPLEVRELDRPEERTVAGWRTADTTRSVVVGERVVVHDTAGGAIVALDEAGTAVWRVLHADAPPWWQPEMMESPGTSAFLEELAFYGLVATPSAMRMDGQ